MRDKSCRGWKELNERKQLTMGVCKAPGGTPKKWESPKTLDKTFRDQSAGGLRPTLAVLGCVLPLRCCILRMLTSQNSGLPISHLPNSGGPDQEWGGVTRSPHTSRRADSLLQQRQE